ncbi:hypothetical protein FIBSPDRAFT_485480 [Athelia psychrophila]|uniref:Uncharacterized protein n=1 Tax=Athelia psychrophila TaxID=1759441 RepID=A0A166KWF0_9AGAM|nr:hypothetical protein FIBSPDRAFT_485480 [Fibularhizoctonia sp. CBS 109695]
MNAWWPRSITSPPIMNTTSDNWLAFPIAGSCRKAGERKPLTIRAPENARSLRPSNPNNVKPVGPKLLPETLSQHKGGSDAANTTLHTSPSSCALARSRR